MPSAKLTAVTAAIIAGGRARRFGGADKSSLLVSGTRIVERQLAALSPIANDILIISHEPVRYAGLDIPVIRDVVEGTGPIGGIYTALLSARQPWVLALGCDMPFVSTALFEALVGGAADDVEVVVPRSARGLEPLCALYATRTIPIFKRRVETGAWRLGELIEEVRLREIDADTVAALDEDGRLFENINTPHDYARAREVKQSR